MAEIKLKCGSIVLLDDNDLPLVSMNTWAICGGYVTKKIDINGKRRLTIAMHRVIMGDKDGQVVDHINGDILDNRRENLRFATNSQNRMNTRKSVNCSSQFKGVYWSSKANKWCAKISVPEREKRHKHLGSFTCEHEAGHAYNKAAIEFFGDFACLNPVGVAP